VWHLLWLSLSDSFGCGIFSGFPCLTPYILQTLREQDRTVAEKERALARFEDAAQQQQQQLARQEEAVIAASKQLEAERGAAALQVQDLERQRKSCEGTRRALANVEAALDARESMLQDSWHMLQVRLANLFLSAHALCSTCCCDVGVSDPAPAAAVAAPAAILHKDVVCCIMMWFSALQRHHCRQEAAMSLSMTCCLFELLKEVAA
jgi:hypothetical protein